VQIGDPAKFARRERNSRRLFSYSHEGTYLLLAQRVSNIVSSSIISLMVLSLLSI
jgi:hypothetical protein